MQDSKQFKNRKVFLINPAFQWNYIKHTVFITLTVLISFYAANLYHFWSFQKRALKAGLPENHIFFEFLRTQQSSFEKIFILASLLTAVLMIGYGIFLSHKVAGPLYRMIKHLQDSQGKESIRDLKFRKGDYFPELAEEFNKFANRKSKK